MVDSTWSAGVETVVVGGDGGVERRERRFLLQGKPVNLWVPETDSGLVVAVNEHRQAA